MVDVNPDPRDVGFVRVDCAIDETGDVAFVAGIPQWVREADRVPGRPIDAVELKRGAHIVLTVITGGTPDPRHPTLLAVGSWGWFPLAGSEPVAVVDAPCAATFPALPRRHSRDHVGKTWTQIEAGFGAGACGGSILLNDIAWSVCPADRSAGRSILAIHRGAQVLDLMDSPVGNLADGPCFRDGLRDPLVFAVVPPNAPLNRQGRSEAESAWRVNVRTGCIEPVPQTPSSSVSCETYGGDDSYVDEGGDEPVPGPAAATATTQTVDKEKRDAERKTAQDALAALGLREREQTAPARVTGDPQKRVTRIVPGKVLVEGGLSREEVQRPVSRVMSQIKFGSTDTSVGLEAR